MYPIVLTVDGWSKYITNRCILFNTDKQALVHVLNKQIAKHKHILLLLRKLVLMCLKLNRYFKAQHLRSKENILFDRFSRLKINQFFTTDIMG